MSRPVMWLAALALLTSSCDSLTWVRTRNQAVEAGEQAYAKGQADNAVEAFDRAQAAQPRPAPELLLNLGHAQLQARQPAAAATSYARILENSPAAVGSVARQQLAVLAARRGQVAQALGLLREALVLNPANQDARYDFEALSDYLSRQPTPTMPPAGAGASQQPRPNAPGEAPQPSQGQRAGQDEVGELPQPQAQPDAAARPTDSRPAPNGQPLPHPPSPAPGTRGNGGPGLGAGPAQRMASGEAPGQQRGLDRRTGGGPAGPGGSRLPGTEAAAPDDAQLQTQRERLKAMNLSPAQARQVLEALRAQEKQYLQQLARPAAAPPDPSKPTW